MAETVSCRVPYNPNMVRIAVVADYNPAFPPHPATDAALEHSARALQADLESKWLPTPSLDVAKPAEILAAFDGFLIAPGSPYASMQGALSAIRFARENDRPLLATCGGFQRVVIEFARNVLGFEDAQHAEYDPYASRLFVSRLKCSLAGKTLSIDLVDGSRAAQCYGRGYIEERYDCNFGLNPEKRLAIEAAGLRTTGIEAGEESSKGDTRVIELPNLRYFIATLFVPQMLSTPNSPHPLVTAFLRAALIP